MNKITLKKKLLETVNYFGIERIRINGIRKMFIDRPDMTTTIDKIENIQQRVKYHNLPEQEAEMIICNMFES